MTLTGTLTGTLTATAAAALLITAMVSQGSSPPESSPRESNTGDWLHWRGPAEDGTSEERGLPGRWSRDGENLAWRAPIGSRSTPIVLGDRVFLMTRGGSGPTEREQVVCLGARDGKVLWERRMPVFLTDIPSNRIGWTSLAGDRDAGGLDRIYAHGSQGLLVALDRDGNTLWERSLTEEFGRFSGYGGRLQNPVVDRDLVIVGFLSSGWGDQARMWHRFVALDKTNGQVRWWSSPGGPPLDTNYSTPVIAMVEGKRLLITGAGDGAVHALKVATGEPVWHFRLSKRGINSSVVVEGARVFVSHSEENLDRTTMGRLVAIDATGQGDVTGAKEVWRIDELMAGYASPALRAGRLYVVDNSANLECISTKDGARIWKHSLGTVGKGSPVWGDGKIYVAEVNGKFHILEDGAQGCRPLDVEEFESADGTVVELNGSPAVSGGTLYFSTRDETFALRSKDGERPLVPGREAGGAPSSGPPSHLQVFPADVVLRPGDSAAFEAQLFGSLGQPLKQLDAGELTLTAKGVKGEAAGNRFTAAADAPFQGGLLEVRSGGLTANVRVRVVPPLPLKEDFEKYEPGKQLPAGWVGVSPMKFQVVERDGSRVLKKLANNALFQRSEVFFGRPEWTEYTLQADVLGTYARRNLPDIGLIGCRYTFYITKDSRTRRKVARLVAWLPMPRIDRQVPFEWKQDVWYRMKMRVDRKGEGGLVRGKVWPRSEPEPAAWTVEMEDPLPTLNGSPGLAAYSPGITERSEGPIAFFDNIEVTGSRD